MNESQVVQAYVRTDEHGVRRVGQGRVMLDSVVAAFREGHSPETIREQYPALSLEEVYGALTYFLAHASEVEAYLRQQDGVWADWQARANSTLSPVVARLRALRRAGEAPEIGAPAAS
ncbi:MAG: DUF433 domain-containing protein [Chloroflexota bacterium]|nr:DUF433 domain-containing protein [Chloroflexota bacterium]